MRFLQRLIFVMKWLMRLAILCAAFLMGILDGRFGRTEQARVWLLQQWQLDEYSGMIIGLMLFAGFTILWFLFRVLFYIRHKIYTLSQEKKKIHLLKTGQRSEVAHVSSTLTDLRIGKKEQRSVRYKDKYGGRVYEQKDFFKRKNSLMFIRIFHEKPMYVYVDMFDSDDYYIDIHHEYETMLKNNLI